MNIITLALATSLAAPVPAEKPKAATKDDNMVVMMSAASIGCGIDPPKIISEVITLRSMRDSGRTPENYVEVMKLAAEIFVMNARVSGELPDFCKRMAKAYEGMK